MKRKILFLLILKLICASNAIKAETPNDSLPVLSQEKRMQWWRDARLGMFVHWGLYSELAGVRNGEEIEGNAEWIQDHAKIPNQEYEKLMQKFNPVNFNAVAWVKLAKEAGIKYLVITGKHHDGFAMYNSKVSNFNIMKTPFAHDPMKELAKACKKFNIKLGFYYSHVLDWHEPGGMGNTWDFKPSTPAEFARYFNEKAIPQVRELLTNYGPVGLIWFDVWFDSLMTKEQAQRMKEMIRSIQPDCIINGRIHFGLGDYEEGDDNQMTAGNVNKDWETPVTMNDSWGYKKCDQNWKSVSLLIRQMVRIISHGGNYLVNVGPTAEGEIPQPSVDRLKEIGKWLDLNNESVRGTGPSPFLTEMSWGMVTSRQNKLYLHVFNWPNGNLDINGIKTRIKKAYLLSDPEKKSLKVIRKEDKPIEWYYNSIQVPVHSPDPNDAVVVLEFDRKPECIPSIIQDADGTVVLNAFQSEIIRAASDSKIDTDPRGFTINWTNTSDSLVWKFHLYKPGEYAIEMISSPFWGEAWQGKHKMKIDIVGNEFHTVLTDNGKKTDPFDPASSQIISNIGKLIIEKAGEIKLSLKALKIDGKQGVRLASIKLIPQKQ